MSRSRSACASCREAQHPGPAPETVNAMLSSMRTVVAKRAAIYVSTPITTGRRLVSAVAERSPDEVSQEDRRLVTQDNIRAAIDVVNQVRSSFPHRPVIDPTALEDRPDWQQHHYHSFWLAVIDEFVGTLVMCEGWEFSTGCSYEYVRGLHHQLPIYNSDLELISIGDGTALLRQALRECRAHDLDVTALEQALSASEQTQPYEVRAVESLML